MEQTTQTQTQIESSKPPFHFSLIVACDTRGGIGKNNTIPWHIKSDIQHFKNITTSDIKTNAVIMGRKTWESIGVPLNNRLNIVITSSPIEHQYNYQNCQNIMFLPSLHHALSLLEKSHGGDVFVIGGSTLYNEAIHMQQCKRIYLTHIFGDYDCDVYFPLMKCLQHFRCDYITPICTEKGIHYKMIEYIRA
jgi:dihydrofolate reductase